MDTELLPSAAKLRRFHKPDPIPDLDALPDSCVVTRNQAAALSRYKPGTLKKWAREGRGPPVTMIEGRPRYQVGALRRWLSGRFVAE